MTKIVTYECDQCGCEVVVTSTSETDLMPIYCCGLEVKEVSAARKKATAAKKVKKPARKVARKTSARKTAASKKKPAAGKKAARRS